MQEYTLEELLYEFYDRVERNKAEEERSDKLSDRMEEERFQNNLDWAEEEERKELEALRKKQEAEAKNPTENEENIEWMQEQIQKEIEAGKKLYGEDFGEEIDEEF